MATLTVSTTTNFSAAALSGIDTIDFTNLISGATATFLASQFDDSQILTGVTIDGSAAANTVTVNTTGNLDASAWTFTNWTAALDSVRFNGSSAANRFVGATVREFVTAGDGDDTVVGSAGNDSLNGGTGIDTLDFSAGTVGVTVDLGLGTGTGGDAQGDTYAGFDIVLGTNQNDILRGGGIAELLQGNNDNDSLEGGGGNDTLDGGAHRDTMLGGEGDDVIRVSGADTVSGEVIGGGAGGADRIQVLGFAFLGAVDISGVEILDLSIFSNVQIGGTDIGALGEIQSVIGTNTFINILLVSATNGMDLSAVTFTDWDDAVDTVQIGNSANGTAESFIGSPRADEIALGSGADTIDAGAGDDRFAATGVITPGLRLLGGSGTDTLKLSGGVSDLSVVSFDGVETVSFNGSAELVFNAGQLGGPGDIERIEDPGRSGKSLTIRGGSFNMGDIDLFNWDEDGTILIEGSDAAGDVIFGGPDGRETLRGLAGDDTLNGGAGSDTLDGGTGTDSLIGGGGDDRYTNPKGDTIVELDGEGIDTVYSSQPINITPFGNVENLTLTGSGSITGNGNALANVITGNAGGNILQGFDGNDTIKGAEGADTMRGGEGNDTYVNPVLSGTGADTIEELENGGTDIVQSNTNVSIAALANVERVTLAGPGDIDATGNALANVLLGNDGANVLTGGSGADTLNGGKGKDILIGGKGNDVMNGGSEADTFRFAVSDTGNDQINAFSSAADRFDLAGGSFSNLAEANGSTTLTHAGGTVRINGVTGLTLDAWNALVLPAGGSASADLPAAFGLLSPGDVTPGPADWLFA